MSLETITDQEFLEFAKTNPKFIDSLNVVEQQLAERIINRATKQAIRGSVSTQVDTESQTH